MSLPFAHTSGPQHAKIALIGEAWGEQEDMVGRPFVGSSGQELTRMLRHAGLSRNECLLTNVLALRPPSNNLKALCGKKADVGKDYPWPPLTDGQYLLPQYLPEIERLRLELTECKPNLAVALGATASWALLQSAKIGSIRGATANSTLIPGLKVLPTYHPSAVLRNWALRPIVLADLMKAKREAEFPHIIRPVRHVLINPTLDEIYIWLHTEAARAPMLSVDIETGRRQIKCIGIATSRERSIVVPFVDMTKPGGSYWPSIYEELTAWGLINDALSLPCPKLFQNGMYDLQYLYRMGLRPRNCTQDTMLLHHSLYPELQKGLGFLGSLYTNEASWKLMNRNNEEKRDA